MGCEIVGGGDADADGAGVSFDSVTALWVGLLLSASDGAGRGWVAFSFGGLSAAPLGLRPVGLLLAPSMALV